MVEGASTPVPAMVYSVPEAAQALGRTELTFKSWISKGVVPPPILRETTRGYPQYSVGEIRAIADEVARHERSFVYLSKKHEDTVARIWRAVQRHRTQSI